VVSRHLGTVIEQERTRAVFVGKNPPHATFHPALSTGGTILFEQHANDHAHALERSRETFEKERLEHDYELAELHVVFGGAAIIHHGTEQHVLEERIRDVTPYNRTRRFRGCGQGNVIVRAHEIDELAKAVDLGWEMRCDFAFEDRKIVREAQGGFAVRAKGDA